MRPPSLYPQRVPPHLIVQQHSPPTNRGIPVARLRAEHSPSPAAPSDDSMEESSSDLGAGKEVRALSLTWRGKRRDVTAQLILLAIWSMHAQELGLASQFMIRKAGQFFFLTKLRRILQINNNNNNNIYSATGSTTSWSKKRFVLPKYIYFSDGKPYNSHYFYQIVSAIIKCSNYEQRNTPSGHKQYVYALTQIWSNI